MMTEDEAVFFSETLNATSAAICPAHRAPSAKIKRDAELFLLLEQTLPIVVFELDRRGVFLQMQGSGLDRIGLAQGHYVGTNALQLFARETFIEPLHQAVAGEPMHTFAEYGGLPWEMWCIPARDGQGQVESIVGITLDISDAKRMEKELRSKLDLIERQERVIRALTTPIIEVWDRVVLLPLLGVVDSGRSGEVMTDLLTHIARTKARFAILDLTGVEVVDSGTASHLLKLIRAMRLLGAEGIVTGLRPSVARTMISLGIDLKGVVTLTNLREGLHRCIRLMRDERV